MSKIRLQRQVRKYLRQIGYHLPFSNRAKKIILHNLYNGIEEYIAIFPNATMEDIYNHFGTYQEVVSDIIENSSSFFQKKDLIFKHVSVVSFLAVLLLILGNYYSHRKNN